MTPPDPVPSGDLAALLAELDQAQAWSLALVEPLTAEEVTWRPHADSSAIGWHLGHQAAVAHYMVRNLTAAEPSFDPDLDRLFDSATPEPARGVLPPIAEILAYRERIAASVRTTVGRIDAGEVGAPTQLRRIADGLLRAVVNHEYQHAAWIGEVRATMTDQPPPEPGSTRLAVIDGYLVLG